MGIEYGSGSSLEQQQRAERLQQEATQQVNQLDRISISGERASEFRKQGGSHEHQGDTDQIPAEQAADIPKNEPLNKTLNVKEAVADGPRVADASDSHQAGVPDGGDGSNGEDRPDQSDLFPDDCRQIAMEYEANQRALEFEQKYK